MLDLGTPYMIAKFYDHIGDPDDWPFLFDAVWWLRDMDSYPVVYKYGLYE